MNDYYFYVIKTADNKLYAGTSNDYLKRFETHKAKRGAKFTRITTRHPLKLIFAQKFNSKGDALSFEIEFKKYPRLKKEQYIKTTNNLVDTPIF